MSLVADSGLIDYTTSTAGLAARCKPLNHQWHTATESEFRGVCCAPESADYLLVRRTANLVGTAIHHKERASHVFVFIRARALVVVSRSVSGDKLKLLT